VKIGSICDGVYDPSSDKCYKNNFEAPTCPGFATKNEPNGGRDAMGICPNPNTGFPQSVPCGSDGDHIDHVGKYACIFDKSPLNPDGSCPTG